MKKNFPFPIQTIKILLASVLFYTSNSSAVEVSLSGQVSRLIMDVDNGQDSGIVHADNSASGTRWRLKGSKKFKRGVQVGVLYESQLQSNPSSKVSVATLDNDGDGGDIGEGDNFTLRQSNAWIKGRFGKLTIGLGSGAANGTAEADKSATNVVQYVGASGSMLGAMVYGSTTVTVAQARSSFDALGRHNNIRYDIKLGPFSLAASHGNGDKVEASIKYKVKKFEIRSGFWDEADSGGDVKGSAISAAWGGKKGFNLSASLAGDDSGAEPSNQYVKIGYRLKKNAFAIDWSETKDKAPGKASSASLAWVNSSLKSIQTYLSYRVEELDAGGDDVTAFIAGARVKF